MDIVDSVENCKRSRRKGW